MRVSSLYMFHLFMSAMYTFDNRSQHMLQRQLSTGVPWCQSVCHGWFSGVPWEFISWAFLSPYVQHGVPCECLKKNPIMRLDHFSALSVRHEMKNVDIIVILGLLEGCVVYMRLKESLPNAVHWCTLFSCAMGGGLSEYMHSTLQDESGYCMWTTV